MVNRNTKCIVSTRILVDIGRIFCFNLFLTKREAKCGMHIIFCIIRMIDKIKLLFLDKQTLLY